MNIEQIKKELSESKELPKWQHIAGENHVLTTYYTPLEASHRELVEALEIIKKELFSTFGVSVPSYVETSFSNAKKLL